VFTNGAAFLVGVGDQDLTQELMDSCVANIYDIGINDRNMNKHGFLSTINLIH
jgi:hypothetical protein